MFKDIKDVRMDGKTVIITGANIGLGRESAMDLARRGARIIVACRSTARGEEAADCIRQDTGNDNVVVQQLDLASLQSVREFADRINQTEERLDVLMNNAGVMNIPERTLTSDGFEMQIGVNHFGHFLLTHLLLDLLKKSAPSRVVNLSSAAHTMGVMNWDDLSFEKGGYGGWPAYGQSKLANILFTKSLHKRLAGTDVTTYAVHPGIVKTNLLKHTGCCVKCLVSGFLVKVSKGARTQIYCSICPGIEQYSGQYFVPECKLKAPKAQTTSMTDAERLWGLSLEMTGLPAET